MPRRSTLLRRALAWGVPFALGAAPTLAIAAALPEEVVHGCYHKNSGQLRIVRDPSQCNPSENAISWDRVGLPGLIWQGPWVNTMTYEADDAVSFNGSSYVSLAAQNVGHPPETSPAFWGMLARKGDTGATGATGAAGAPGGAGATGPAGHSPVLTWTGDRIAIDGVASGPNLTGPQGPIGLTGPQGPQGAQGPAAATCTAPAPEGLTCATAVNLGNISWGGSIGRTGILPVAGAGEAWYRVMWGNSASAFHPHVRLSSGGATAYVFDVFTNCSGTFFYPGGACNGTGAYGSLGSVDWETINPSNPEVNFYTCVAPGQAVYVRVRPVTTNPGCAAYTVVFQNG